ncbi:DUF2924 domain-containing protein [Aestuariicoccus sp. MJ-SS9]|uniref:DUF2924 domain-containing protein n=1 Tax=Aestuariicoccus sp. MJ-SS9 TaxID=3079855 RepID=UPI002907E681|nr:DUF2924 domain-containing protein [Aestuariicoccus sp. MJ-SS9]MDU8913210.1 DUF2924 domain-containing protein [Aestuariicoccus sp. MJ-SS9]
MKLTVARIETMDRAALVAAWTDLFGTPVPKSLSQAFLRRFLAFELQSRRYGGLPKGFLADLGHRARVRGAVSPALQPGGRLLREWNGVTHEVEVMEAGYRWNRNTYRSLSAVARAITGARWSGPRFFGLKEDG